MADKKNFPKDFLWGASTAAHQVEGGNRNQWTVWELAHAGRLAAKARKEYGHLQIWPDIKKAAEDPLNYVSGNGVDHYNRFEEDFDILNRLNLNAFRFGIEWSRLEPEEGRWDEREFQHYKDYIKGLKMRGIKPILNIWHWTQPFWFEERGGFSRSRNLKYWHRLIKKISSEFADEIDYILTINEPNVYSLASYLAGEWPPQKRNPFLAMNTMRNLIRAHKYAYTTLKREHPSLMVGAAPNFITVKVRHPIDPVARLVSKFMEYAWNWWFVDRIKKHMDFTSFNFYTTIYASGPTITHPVMPRQNMGAHNDLGWYMEPGAIIHPIIKAWKRYKKPIIVTENGVADMHDRYRRWWIDETIQAMSQARELGVEVIGYLHWSLLDNFEWDKGWWPKFGLVTVDRENGMKRTVRESAKWFAEFIASQER